MRRSRCYICLTRGHAYWNCKNKTRKTEFKKVKGKKYNGEDTWSKKWKVEGTDDGWEDLWYVSNEYSRHMTPNIGLFEKFTAEITGSSTLNQEGLIVQGIGEVIIQTQTRRFVIPGIYYVPNEDLNMLSLSQLEQQGFEIIFKNTCCTVKRLFDDTSQETSSNDEEETGCKKEQQMVNITRLDEGIPSKEVYIKIEGMQVPITVNSFARFLEFMKMVSQNRIAMRNYEVFRNEFDNMLDWYYKWNEERPDIGEIPPKVDGLEVCLFDVYNLVKCLGGYEKVTKADSWESVSMGFGFPDGYGKEFKKMYERYLLLPVAHYEFARGDAIGDLQDIGSKTNESMDQKGDSGSSPREDDQEASMDKANGCNSRTGTTSSKETNPGTSGSIGKVQGNTTKIEKMDDYVID